MRMLHLILAALVSALPAQAHALDAQRALVLVTCWRAAYQDGGPVMLLDRRKDMIISGGFNIYHSDLEAQLRAHPVVADVAVVGVPSRQWGETPVAFVVPRAGQPADAQALRAWFNQRAGKTQRLADLRLVDELPRSAIGKVLKRELRQDYGSAPA